MTVAIVMALTLRRANYAGLYTTAALDHPQYLCGRLRECVLVDNKPAQLSTQRPALGRTARELGANILEVGA